MAAPTVKYRIKMRVYTELAWHSHVHPRAADPARARGTAHYVPDFTILSPAVVQGRSEAPRRAHRNGDRARFHQARSF